MSGHGGWRGRPVAGLMVLAVAAAFGGAAAAAPGKAPPLAAADRSFREQSYARALAGYEAARRAGQVPPARRDAVDFRIAVCLGKMQRWDRALASALTFVKERRGTVWEPRGLSWLGRLYRAAPHYGYRVGKRLYRGEEPPRSTGGGAPVWASAETEDERNARDALEAAHLLFPAFREEHRTQAAEVEVALELADLLAGGSDFYRWASDPTWAPPGDASWQVLAGDAYSHDWPPPKKIRFLYETARALAPGGGAARSLFVEGRWLQAYHAEMRGYARRFEKGREVRVPYPYEAVSPVTLLARLVHEFPGDRRRDEAQVALGAAREAEGQDRAAVATYRNLIATRPAGRWADEARARVEAITRPTLALRVDGPQLPGQPARFRLVTRNVKQARLALYPVRLETALAPANPPASPAGGFLDFSATFGTIAAARRRCGLRAAAWTVTTGDRGDHHAVTDQLTAPRVATGAYVLAAEAIGPLPPAAATVLLVTDLAVVQKRHRGGVLLFVVDARSGRPVPGARVLARQQWDEKEAPRAAFSRGRTGADGVLEIPLLRARGRDQFQVETLAYAGSRYAVTGPSNAWYWGDEGVDQAGALKTYVTTDRAVYRPGQTVAFRAILMRQDRGEWKPEVDRRVVAEARDPNGRTIATRALRTGAFGSVNGRFEIPAEAPLSEYSLRVRPPGERRWLGPGGSGFFRVEEYRKPEFAVTVTPEAERVRLGEPARARIRARYYAGGPVPFAKVTWRAFRKRYAPDFDFAGPYDFLFAGRRSYGRDGRGPLVADGEARAGADGEVVISFDTGSPEGGAAAADLTYTIQADVQDASRRVVSGAGMLNATRHDVALFLNFSAGYATTGEHVEVEVASVNASGQPVAAAVTAWVLRGPDAEGQPETAVHEEWLDTGPPGRALFRWAARAAGRYRLAFTTRDGAGEEVSADRELWVQGHDLEQGRFHYRDLFLAVKSPYGEEGQAARLLLATPAPGCVVLLTREAGGEVLERRLVRVPGRSREVNLPLSRRDVPNVYMAAVMVRDGRFYSARRELLVPPTRRLASVTVRADRERYRPGEKARFTLAARDQQGRPLQAELSLAVTDAALAYVQQDLAPEIRTFFYGDRRWLAVEAVASPNARFIARREAARQSLAYYGRGYLAGVVVASRPRRLSRVGSFPGFAGSGRGEPFAYNSELRVRYREVTLPGAAPRGGDVPASEEAPELDEAPARLRREFLDTALWAPSVVTGADGSAAVEVTWPDNLTEWRAQAVGATRAAQVGSGEARVRTKQDLLLRLAAPRFMVERDAVVVSGVVRNDLPQVERVRVTLALDGGAAEVVGSSTGQAGEPAPLDGALVEVPAGGEARVDWTLRARQAGELVLRGTATAASESDAVEVTLPVLAHGIERVVTRSGVLRGARQEVTLDLPEARGAGSAELVVTLNPSLAATTLDALPYLADYPYGCVEQTMSRFLPAVIVARTLQETGYDLAALRRRAASKADQSPSAPRATHPSPFSRPNPVFDGDELDHMTRAGLGRLRQFQHRDGGWGWWAADASDPYMSACVIEGLLLGRAAGLAVEAGMLERGLNYLQRRFLEEEDPHQLAYEARVLAMEPGRRAAARARTVGPLYARRGRLSPYGLALLALALSDLGERGKAAVVLRNLENTVRVDAGNGTASWPAAGWEWYGSRVEANAAILQAYLAARPRDRLVAPLVKWLVNNRRESEWGSTKETARAVLALAAYARASGELDPEQTVTVDLGGGNKRTYTITRENALFFDNRFALPDALLRTGKQVLTLTRDGAGPLYWSATLRYFSREEPIPAAGYEIFVRRRYFRLTTPDNRAAMTDPRTPNRGVPAKRAMGTRRPTANPFLTGEYERLDQPDEGEEQADIGAPEYERHALGDGEAVASGDLIEVELEVEAKNDYSYLLVEDLKPAGCEPVELHSGERAAGSLYSNVELRDQKVAFFLTQLPQGRRQITYRLRAEAPGRFHVLPTSGAAMYAPDLRALSDEGSIGVE